jgi:hypothetical protein
VILWPWWAKKPGIIVVIGVGFGVEVTPLSIIIELSRFWQRW